MLKRLVEMILCSLLGVIMLISKMLMEFLPNVHLVAMLIVLCTVVFRSKALISIYIFVFLSGFVSGFGVWWVPYLYVWAVLWAAAMLIPKNILEKKVLSVVVFCTVCGLHGFLFGTLYAPFQAFAFGLDFKGTIAWIIAGLPFDFIHGISNILAATLILPVAIALKKALMRVN